MGVRGLYSFRRTSFWGVSSHTDGFSWIIKRFETLLPVWKPVSR